MLTSASALLHDEVVVVANSSCAGPGELNENRSILIAFAIAFSYSLSDEGKLQFGTICRSPT